MDTADYYTQSLLRGVKRKRSMGGSQQSSDYHRRVHAHSLADKELGIRHVAANAIFDANQAVMVPHTDISQEHKAMLSNMIHSLDVHRRLVGQPVFSVKEGFDLGLYVTPRGDAPGLRGPPRRLYQTARMDDSGEVIESGHRPR